MSSGDINMQPYQHHVIAEKTELDDRLNKLSAFLDTPFFAELHIEERERLERQEHYMMQYSLVLGERIAAFTD